MTKQKSFLKPLAELIVAAAFWGFGFTATVWALEFLDVAAVAFYRFLIAFIFGFALLSFSKRPWAETKEIVKTEFLYSFWPGLWMYLTIALQAWGLYSTTATKSAFITVLYVIMVPFVTTLTGKEKLSLIHFFCAILALVGIVIFQNLQWAGWTTGDSLTLLAAAAATLHILTVGKRAPLTRSPYIFNLGQAFWTAVLALLYYPWSDRWNLFSMSSQGWLAMLALALGSGLLAFYLQVRAQEKIPPSLASMLFLLESPFSALFAFLLLNEKLESHHLAGGAVILAACAWAIKVDSKVKPPVSILTTNKSPANSP